MPTLIARYRIVEMAIGVFTILFIALGFYIGEYEIDLKPTPRALFSLAGSHYENGNLTEARHYWRLCADYHLYYGEDYRNPAPIQLSSNPYKYVRLANEYLHKTKWEIKYGGLPNLFRPDKRSNKGSPGIRGR